MRLFWKTLAVFFASAAAFWGAAALLGREFDLPAKALLALWLVILFSGALARAMRDGNRSRRALYEGVAYEEAFGLESPVTGQAGTSTVGAFLRILRYFALTILVLAAIGAQESYPGNLFAMVVSVFGQAVALSAIAAVLLHVARYGVAGQGDTSLSDIETDTRPVGNPFYGYTTYERNYPFSSH